MKLSDKNYEDTAEGAIQFLRDVSTLDLTNATAKSDPDFPWVWLVHHPEAKGEGDHTVVYLADQDFETGEFLGSTFGS